MDDFGNTLPPRHHLFGYVWWMYGLESYRSFAVDEPGEAVDENDIP